MNTHALLIRKQSMRSVLFITTLLISSCLALSACSQQSNLAIDYSKMHPSESGGTLISAMTAEPSSLIFMVAGESASAEIASNLFNSLLTYNAQLDIKGELANSWEVSNQQKTITFKLKPNLKWADGKPLTSADVLFTWQLVTDENTRSPYASDFQLVTKAEAPDALTFIVTYNQAYAPALDSWSSLHILPNTC